MKRRKHAIKRDQATIESLREASQMLSQRNYQGCIQVCHSILARTPQEPEALYMLSSVAVDNRQFQQAYDLIGKAIAFDDSAARYFEISGVASQHLGLLEDAEANFKHAIHLYPDLEVAHNNLGCLYVRKDDFRSAQSYFEKAVKIRPSYYDARVNLALVLVRIGTSYLHDRDLDTAARYFEQAAAVEPVEKALAYLGNIRSTQGKHHEAFEIYQRLLANITSPSLETISNFLLILNYDSKLDPEEVFRLHAHWGAKISASIPKLPPVRVEEKPTNQPLKVGYVSADFKSHSVAFFLESLLTGHDPQRVAVYCYSDVGKETEVTDRLRSITPNWRDIHKMDRYAAAQLIRSDGIDILVDLGGHTNGENHLPVFAAKPAPIQATYLGYPNTTGLPEIDYRITDEIADPPGLSDTFNTERLTRLRSCFLSYSPNVAAPEIAARSTNQDQKVVFGCFNNFNKLNEGLISVWARILLKTPSSSLFLKTTQLTDKDARSVLLAKFAALGVAEDQIRLHGRVESNREHLLLYNQIDIALDSYPYNGTTTTFEALWMGVPVITLAGQIHASRVGTSILTHLHRSELIAQSEPDYIDKAVSLSQDRAMIAEYRKNLRKELSRSSLLDGKRLASELEETYFKWYQRCFSNDHKR